ncbi:MAG TPA: gluconokinase [Symbiobacteriaceae bacterium]
MYVIGADIGTTSAKAILFDLDGRIVASHSVEYPLYTPRPGWAEQDPVEILEAVVQSIRETVAAARVDPAQVAAVGFSSAMHSLIPLDGQFQPLGRALIWADNRAAEQANRIKREMGGHEIYRRTGTPIHPMSPLTKLLWIKEQQPDLFQRARYWAGLKEFVLHRLTGQWVMDIGLASATGLFNLERLDWDEEALALTGVRREQLPNPVDTTHVLRGVKPDYARAMGLPAGVVLVAGAGDGTLSNLGTGAIERGVVAATIGTSGAIRQVTNRPVTDPSGRTFCYALTRNHWVVGGAISNGGIVLRWFRDNFAGEEKTVARLLGEDPYDVITRYAARVEPGAGGLILLPFLSGERAPYWNANARGVLFGLALHHTRAHMARAVLESVIYAMYSVHQALEEQAGPSVEIRATGGFARSPLWLQIMADVFGREVVVAESHESSCLGAAVLAMVGTDLVPGLQVVHRMVRTRERRMPNPSAHAVYQELFSLYQQVYRQTEQAMDAIAAFQRR